MRRTRQQLDGGTTPAPAVTLAAERASERSMAPNQVCCNSKWRTVRYCYHQPMVPRLRDLLKPKKSRSGALPPSVEGPAISASSSAWDEVFQHAQSLQQQGQLDEAIAMYGDCIERAPERAEAYYKRANVLNGLGRL